MEEATEPARSAAPRFALFEAEAHEGHQIGRLGGRGGIEETRAKGRDRERLGVPTEAEVIRGPQRPSAVISGHQRSSEAIRGNQRPSADRDHPIWASSTETTRPVRMKPSVTEAASRSVSRLR